MATQDLFSLSRKMALTKTTFLVYIVPPIVCVYLMGVLVQLRGTRIYRLALLPVLVWFAWRGAFVDLSGGDPKQAQANTMVITQMCSFAMRGTVWAFAREPFYRCPSSSSGSVLWDAWDLMLTTRGIGWSWSRGVVLPKPTFETDSRSVFAALSMGELVWHSLGFDACLQLIRLLGPDTFGSSNGGSLFDHVLPPHLELLRAVLVAGLTACMSYFAIQWGYRLLAIVCVVLFRHRPSQWPPLFDAPWRSTSLSELWGRRWHQMMRELVMGLGFRPANHLFGRFAGLMCAFLVSGVFHDMELRSLGRGGNTVVLVGFWVMNGVGVVLERAWKGRTGRRVGGVFGWMWTFGWLALWGVPVVNEWAKTGRLGMLRLPGEIEPVRYLARLKV